MRQAFHTQAFWLIALGGVFVGFSTVAITQNQVPHLVETGFSVAAAAGAVSIVGAFSAGGKFIFGFICDWINPKYSRAIGLTLQTGAVIILLTLTKASPIYWVWSYAVLLGLSYGSWVPAMSMLTSVNFGMKEYGALLGMMTLFNMVGGAIGPLVAGYIYDVQNSYQLAFIIFLVLIIVTTIGTLFIRKPKMN
jgi:MFS family permease